MKKPRIFRLTSSMAQGSLTVEAAVILPFVMVLLYMMMLLPLSEIRFDHFEENLHRWLVESIHHTLQAEELKGFLDEQDQLELVDISWRSGEAMVEVKFAGFRSRRWQIQYPFSRAPFERLVYVTDTGRKYHLWGCIHLRESLVPLIYSRALREYTPCKVCSMKD